MGKKIYFLLGIFLLVLVGFLIASYLLFFHAEKCKTESCWESKLQDCRRAEFVNNAVDVTWKYEIKGKSNEGCEVEVEAVQVIRGLVKTRELEGKSMKCYLPFDSEGKTILISPESDPNLCHGLLKEELQGLIIENLYRYILDNVGKIGDELKSVEGALENS
jgi:hypothetical protein